jgi:hypothetical protein
MLITNAFSLDMLADLNSIVKCTEVPSYIVTKQLRASGVVSAVESEESAELFTTVLGIDVPCASTKVKLVPGDSIFVGQYIDTPLPVGAILRPKGFGIRWVMVDIAAWPLAADFQA